MVADGAKNSGRALVVGCGFIGSNVVEALTEAGDPPVVLTRSRPAEEIVGAIGEANLHLGDAADRAALEVALEGVSRVIFTAGGLLPAASERDPERDRRLTLDPVATTLAALADRPGVGFTYLSSGGLVYGEPAHNPVSESDPTEPTSTYGRLHLECEGMIGRATREAGLRARVLRCSTVYGEHQRPNRGQGAVVTFLHRIRHEQSIDLYGGGATIRDYIYAGDVASVVVRSTETEDGPAVVNVGSGRGTSLLDLLRLVEAEVGRPAKVVEHPRRDFEIDRIVLDTNRLESLVEFEPTPLAAGIHRTAGWLGTIAAESA